MHEFQENCIILRPLSLSQQFEPFPLSVPFENALGVRGLAVSQESIKVQVAQMASQQRSNDRRLRCERRCSAVEKQTVLCKL